MAISTDIKELLKAIGFTLEDGKLNNWKKIYASHNNYKISVDVENESIDFGKSIILGDRTTSNFKAAENFVVFECVDRLLEMGYKPESITLEKDYPLGHKTKGKLDILVTDTEGKAFMMIECKTWGPEFVKACKKTLFDGGQIFSYFQQDKSAQYLLLYASKLGKTTVKYENAIIKVEEYFLQSTNAKDAFEKWNKNLKDNGVFESWATPYNISSKALTKGSLKPLTKEDSSLIFNHFAEILRHNVVSDKPNAFNKFITLLLCKIVDEEKDDAEELQFQWLDDDTNINLQKRLNDLYKIGMKRYLTKVVTDYSDKDVDDKFIGLTDSQKQEIKNIITELRLKKNNEFAFKEVFNDASFDENSKVLKEVVDLLQPFKLRYNKKQQFLGDFFELLLNTSIKQEAGQFFTPVPIARFIINSIPIHHIIHNKASKGDNDFLPYIIDYACGSGHFLTEAMDEINNAIVELNKNNNYRPEIKKKLKIWAEDDPFAWAYDFVYGIEKDYRLVKTAKVSCFLNGDGLARIFNADGLASFETDSDYKERLKKISRTDPQDNQQFEVLVANPPYSVSSFRNTIVNGEKSFELYNRLTENSSEIECLFIERTKQLMKDGGYVGIILPSSILSNGGIYEDAREILLKYFRIVAIVEFGSNTFMATGTNTVTLFLEKRNNSDWHRIQHVVDTFFGNPLDLSCNGIETPFSSYVANTFKTVSFADYVTLINRQPNDTIKAHDIYNGYQNWFNNLTTTKNLKTTKVFKEKTEVQQSTELAKLFFDSVFSIEKEKLIYFILVYPQKVIVVKSNPDGKNETEKAFLGYEFSNRRGHEGIKPYGGRTIQEATKLYDENQMFNPERVNTYIHNAFLNNPVEVHKSLQNHVFVQDLVDLMSFERFEFPKSVSLAIKKKVKIDIESKWDLFKLEEVSLKITDGAHHKPALSLTGIPMLDAIDIDNFEINDKNPQKHISVNVDIELSKRCKPKKDDVLISSRGTIGKIAIVKESQNFNILGNIICITPDTSKISSKYLAYYLHLQKQRLEDTSHGLSQKGLYLEKIREFIVPVPSNDVQEIIIEEIEKVENKELSLSQLLAQKRNEIHKLVQSFKGRKHISEACTLVSGKSEPQKLKNDLLNYIGLEHIESNTSSLVKDWEPTNSSSLKSTKTAFSKGNLLYGKLRPYLNKVYIAEFDGICSTDILAIETKYPRLLRDILLDESFVNMTSSMMKGNSLPRLQVKEFLNLTINYPEADIDLINETLEKIEGEIEILSEHILSIETEKKNILAKYLV